MSRTYRKQYTTSLFDLGGHSHHNSLCREFKGVDRGGCMVKHIRGLINRADYESSRNKGLRHVMSHIRRAAMKRNALNEINNQD